MCSYVVKLSFSSVFSNLSTTWRNQVKMSTVLGRSRLGLVGTGSRQDWWERFLGLLLEISKGGYIIYATWFFSFLWKEGRSFLFLFYFVLFHYRYVWRIQGVWEIVKFCGQLRSNKTHRKAALVVSKDGKSALFLELMPKCLWQEINLGEEKRDCWLQEWQEERT